MLGVSSQVIFSEANIHLFIRSATKCSVLETRTSTSQSDVELWVFHSRIRVVNSNCHHTPPKHEISPVSLDFADVE
jgi:hypothetical protein